MKAKVLQSFSGATVTGCVGSVIEIADKAIFDDLLKAGYIASLEKPVTAKKKKEEKE